MPSTKMEWGGGRGDRGLHFRHAALTDCSCRATVLAFEYLEPEVQEEKTGLEVELQESSACGGYL